jgi:hypothetical protein
MSELKKRKTIRCIAAGIGLALLLPVFHRVLQSVFNEIGFAVIYVLSPSLEAAAEAYARSLAFINILPAVFLTAFVLLFHYILRTQRLTNENPFRLPLPLPAALRAAGAGAGLFLLTVSVFAALIHFALPETVHAQYDEHMTVLQQSPRLLQLVFSIVCAPVVEEIVYRGGCFYQLRRVMPVWAAVLGQSIIFGMIHGNPLQVAYAAALGVPLALVYHWTGSLSAPILFHMAFNAGNYVLLPLLNMSGFAAAHMLLGGPVLAWFCLRAMRNEAQKRVQPQIYE